MGSKSSSHVQESQPPTMSQDEEATERAMLIEAGRHPKPIAQWPLLIFYVSEITTFMYRSFDGGKDLYMDYTRKSTLTAGIIQFVINLIFMFWVGWRVLLADSGGTSRFEHMRVAQRVAHVNIVLLTIILIAVLVFLDLVTLGYSGPHAEYLIQLGIDLCGYFGLFLAWLGPPGKGYGLPSDRPSRFMHVAFGIVIITMSFFQLSSHTNNENKFQTLDTLHLVAETSVIVQIFNIVLSA